MAAVILNTPQEIVTYLNEIREFNSLIENLKKLRDVEYTSPEDIKFKIFQYAFDDLHFTGKHLLPVSRLQDDYDHYDGMMDIKFPSIRKVNKMTRRYNELADKFNGINLDYLIESISTTIQRSTKQS